MGNATAYGILQAVAAALRTGWAASAGAGVAVAEDPAHALELLTAGRPGGCQAVLFYLSDVPDDDEMAEDVQIAAQIRLAVVQSPGLKRRDGGDAPAVLALADAIRLWAANQAFAGMIDGGLKYRGMTHIPTTQGSALHGYALTFEAVYAYDVTVTEPDEDEGEG